MNKEKENPDKKTDKRTMSEKIDDGVENVFGEIEDAIYGPNPDFTHDIPATIKKPDGPRKVNKVQTRKNINKRLFGNKYLWIVLAFLALGGLIWGIYALIEKLLLL